jgi:hypothetical protein
MKPNHYQRLKLLVGADADKMPVTYKQWYSISSERTASGFDRSLESAMHQTQRMFVKPFYKPISMYSILEE